MAVLSGTPSIFASQPPPPLPADAMGPLPFSLSLSATSSLSSTLSESNPVARPGLSASGALLNLPAGQTQGSMLARSPSRDLLAVLTPASLHIWNSRVRRPRNSVPRSKELTKSREMQPTVEVASLVRSSESVAMHGSNESLAWRPDASGVAILVSLPTLLTSPPWRPS